MATPSSEPRVADDLQPGESGDIHLWDYFQVVIQRWPLAVSVFVVVVALAVIYTWTRTPRYTATARLLTDPGQVNLTGLQGTYDIASAMVGRREFTETQAKLITSRPIMEASIEKVGLDLPILRGAEDPVAVLSKAVVVTPVRNTFLIDVSVTAEQPADAAKVVNTVVQSYVEDSRQRKLGISTDGLAELRRTAEGLRLRLDAASKALQELMVKHNMVSFEKTQNLILEKLRELNTQLTSAEPVRMAIQAKLEAAEAVLASGQPADSIPEVMESPIIRQYKLDLAKVETQYSELVLRLGEKHPQLQSLATQLDALRAKIAVESASVIQSLRAQFDQAKRQEAFLRDALKVHEKEVFRFNEVSSQFDLLTQERASLQKTYETIIRRVEEVDISRIGGQGENVLLVSRAAVPTKKSWPNRMRNLLVAIALGTALSVGLCFFLDYMDTTIKSEQDVRNELGARLLGAIPDARDESKEGVVPDLIAIQAPRSHASEAFRSLRTAIAFGVPGAPLRSLVVTSTFPSEGKTLVSVNMAVAHAQLGKKTLIVDADMRKPRMHHVFSASTEKGISNRLAGAARASLDDVIQKTSVPNLWFMSAGPIPANPVELLDSDAFTKLLKDLRERFDLVVFDSPPAFALVDSLVMARHTDGLLLVVRSFVTPKIPARQLAERIHSAGIRLLGIALNNVDMPHSARYGYYYRYGGYYKYYAKYYRHGEDKA